MATGTCICPSGFTGSYCEIATGKISMIIIIYLRCIDFLGQTNCQNVVCANGGICNPIPTTENGVEMQCLCLNGINKK